VCGFDVVVVLDLAADADCEVGGQIVDLRERASDCADALARGQQIGGVDREPVGGVAQLGRARIVLVGAGVRVLQVDIGFECLGDRTGPGPVSEFPAVPSWA